MIPTTMTGVITEVPRVALTITRLEQLAAELDVELTITRRDSRGIFAEDVHYSVVGPKVATLNFAKRAAHLADEPADQANLEPQTEQETD